MSSPFFKLRDPSGRVWPPIPNPKYGSLWAFYLGLEKSQWFDPAQIEAGQLAQLRVVLTHCKQNVPYYRDILAFVEPEAIRSMDDLRRLPLLQRGVYQARFGDMTAQALPPGITQTGTNHTSGSTGIPIEVRTTNVVTLLWWAFYLRDLQWGGIDPRNILCAIRPLTKPDKLNEELMRGVTMPYWQRELNEFIETGTSHGMELSQHLNVQLEWIQRHNPNYLLSYPSNLMALAGLIEERKITLSRLGKIQTIGEDLSEEYQQHIERVFGVPIHNTYSCVEAGYLASPCSAGQGLHVHAENVILEVVDDNGVACQPGQTGKVLLTTLHNYLNPFVRYDIGDEATVGSQVCICGRGLPLLTRVFGKRRPMFLLPSGERKNSWWCVAGVRTTPGVLQWQIIQERRDRVLVRLVTGPSWNAHTEAQLRQGVEEFFEAPMKTAIEIHQRLPTTKGGKVLDVVCLV